jgi:recombinational DNA repair protein (RecF pathway)
MSIFKAEGIVIQVWKYSENELYYKILFRDYGILTVKKRKKAREKPIDIWYFIHCEIITHESKSVHTIGNIKIQSFFETGWRSYSEIESFLKILSLIKSDLPEWSPHYEIYDILSSAINTQESLNPDKLILIHLKTIVCLWNLWESHSDETTCKVLKFVHANKYSQIMRLWSIPEETKKHLEKIL